MLLWQALILGVIQGVGELFPVSSLAQTILIPAMLGWQINQAGSDFLAFVVALHLATAVALVIYFRNDWIKIANAFIGISRHKKLIYDDASKFAWLLVAGTVIVGAIGFKFEKSFRQFFDNPKYYWIVAAVLVANGLLMLAGDWLIKKTSRPSGPTGADNAEGADSANPAAPSHPPHKRAENLSMTDGALIGAAQTFALVPGVSRSGATILAGLLAGLNYQEASRFSFMLATPVIGLAALLKVPSLLKDHQALKLAIPASIVAGLTAYLSVAFLMRYFKHHRLSPFGYYCIGVGALAWMMLWNRS